MYPLPCLHFSGKKTSSRHMLECGLLQECKEITLQRICCKARVYLPLSVKFFEAIYIKVSLFLKNIQGGNALVEH